MSSSNTPGYNSIQNAQEPDTLSNKTPPLNNTDHQLTDNNNNTINNNTINNSTINNNIIDQLVQKPINEPLMYNEMINIPFSRKKSQSKSRIEIRCGDSSGPISPYTIFLKHMHNLLIDANKELTFSQRSVLIANLWAMMSERDKEPYRYSASKINSNMSFNFKI